MSHRDIGKLLSEIYENGLTISRAKQTVLTGTVQTVQFVQCIAVQYSKVRYGTVRFTAYFNSNLYNRSIKGTSLRIQLILTCLLVW